jgi:hypothetical protein
VRTRPRSLSAVEELVDKSIAACNALGLFGGGTRLLVVEDLERWRRPT